MSMLDSNRLGVKKMEMLTFIPDRRFWRNSGYKYQTMLAWVTPQDFYRLAQMQFGKGGAKNEGLAPSASYTPDVTRFHRNTPLENQIKNEIIWGKPQEPPALMLRDAVFIRYGGIGPRRVPYAELVGANPQVRSVGHDGRHRASISEELGIPMIPVRFWIHELPDSDHYEKIWNRADVESGILRALHVNPFRLDYVG